MVRELLIRTADGKTRNVRLERDGLSCGRSSGNDLCYPEDAGLSRQHLVFELAGDDWVVRDLGSKNGTFVNGVRITEKHRLQPGDRVTAGHLIMVFDDPFQGAGEGVVFVESPEEESSTSSTVVTSLDNLIGAQKAAVKAGRPPVDGPNRVNALIRAGRELAGHRPLSELFRVILDLAVEAVGAERGVVMTLEAGRLVVRAANGDNFRISNAVRDRVLNEKTSLLVQDVQQDLAFRERLSIQEHRVHSLMAAPLQTNDEVIGLIYVDSPQVLREFTREDLNLLTVMANVAAIRIEHARLSEIEQAERMMAKDLEQAAEIQRQLLPRSAPAIRGLELAGHNVPCRTVGGDYYDFLTYPDGRVAMALGDVSGKGMPAALLMMSLQARVRVLADPPGDVAEFMDRLNRITASTCPPNRFISLFFCVLNPATGEMCYSNAGHNPPFLVRKGGHVETLEGGGLILGILPGATYEQRCCQLNLGDVLLLYSDGVTEATTPEGEEFGEERLVEVLSREHSRPVAAILDAVTRAVSEWQAGGRSTDDLTLVVARRTE